MLPSGHPTISSEFKMAAVSLMFAFYFKMAPVIRHPPVPNTIIVHVSALFIHS